MNSQSIKQRERSLRQSEPGFYMFTSCGASYVIEGSSERCSLWCTFMEDHAELMELGSFDSIVRTMEPFSAQALHDGSSTFTLAGAARCGFKMEEVPPALHILNTAILPSGADGIWTATTITLRDARGLMERYEWQSHVGHASTAALASTLLGVEVPMDRTPWDGSGRALVVQLAFRGEEGRVYSPAEMIDFHAQGLVTLRVIERVSA